jgi:hypothetical protein
MLRASPGILTKSDGNRLKVRLFTILACVHLAFKNENVAVVPREANRAQKSSCPVITSLSASTSFSICSKALGISSAKGAISSELAPTELNIPFDRCTQRVAKSEHLFRRSFSDSCSFVFFSALASDFAYSSFLSCSKRSDFSFKVVRALSHPVLEGKPNANHVRATIRNSHTQQLHK